MSEIKRPKKTVALESVDFEDITRQDPSYHEPAPPPMLPAEASFWRRTIIFATVAAIVAAIIAFVAFKFVFEEPPEAQVEVEDLEIIE